MNKPDFRVTPPGKLDTDLGERIVRALQDSALHLFAILGMADHPDDPDVAMMVTLTAVTDGERGFLIISEDFAPPRTTPELAELLESACGAAAGDDYAIRVASMSAHSPGSPDTLDLNDANAARAAIERAYHRAFDGRPAIDHAAFFERLAPLRWPVRNELHERQRCRMLDGC